MAMPKKVADIKSGSDADESVVSSSQLLCLTCGFCCDGTLFSAMPLKPDDAVTPLKAAGINIVSDNDLTLLKQPCAAHKNCTCIVYANRPQKCRTYKCELLKRFERDDVFHEAALEIITKAVSLKNEMKALALAASTNMQSAEEVTSLMKRWLRDPSIGATNQGYAHVFLKFMTLQIYLDRFFRKKPIVQALELHTSESTSPSKSSN